MARFVKKYLAGAIPTPQEVADLKGKVNTLEQQNAEKDAKILQLEASDQAFAKSLTDDVVADALVERTIKASIERVDGVIGGTIKDVETLKDRAQNMELATKNAYDLAKVAESASYDAQQTANWAQDVAEKATEQAGKATNTAEQAKAEAAYAQESANYAEKMAESAHVTSSQAGFRANEAFSKASQNENSITGISQTLQNVAEEQQQQNSRLDDLEADAQESGGNFEQLKNMSVLVGE